MLEMFIYCYFISVDDTFYLDTTTGEISMKNILITIIDKAEENLKCVWVIESYIECTPMNVTSINLTDCQTVPISVVENSTNKLIFNMCEQINLSFFCLFVISKILNET